MNIKEFGQIGNRLGFKPIMVLDLYKSFSGERGLVLVNDMESRLNGIEDIYFKAGDAIGRSKAVDKYNKLIDSYNAQFDDEPEEWLDRKFHFTIKLHPILLNSEEFDNIELFGICQETGTFQFAELFNKTLLEYLYYKKGAAQKLDIPDVDISEIDLQITRVKKWFFENDSNPNDLIPFIPELNKTQNSDSKEKDEIVKKNYNGFIYGLADDMRYRKDNGEFETYREAYRWAAKHFTVDGQDITWKKLEKNYDKSASAGKV